MGRYEEKWPSDFNSGEKEECLSYQTCGIQLGCLFCNLFLTEIIPHSKDVWILKELGNKLLLLCPTECAAPNATVLSRWILRITFKVTGSVYKETCQCCGASTFWISIGITNRENQGEVAMG